MDQRIDLTQDRVFRDRDEDYIHECRCDRCGAISAYPAGLCYDCDRDWDYKNIATKDTIKDYTYKCKCGRRFIYNGTNLCDTCSTFTNNTLFDVDKDFKHISFNLNRLIHMNPSRWNEVIDNINITNWE